ncbi:hypothetical protein BG61_24060 [Caballeronia glathei]|uniref:Uncharacterized protein n=1 Tax=Caballeronia glathei TaxID=60547 RepID=A0A069PJT7_9BURK|nr:hypothetical protein BG61_24060 [Caballeronia glathei]
MKPSGRGPDRHAGEVAHILEYALSGVAKEFRRLLLTNWQQHRKVLGQSDKHRSQRRIRALLSKAFAAALLSASDGASAKQCQALMYILTAAWVPDSRALNGLPAELQRQRRQGVR